MSEVVTLEQVEAMATQLPPREQLKLISDLSAGLTTLPIMPQEEVDEEELRQQREKEADELLAMCDAIAEQWEEFDVVEEIRQMRAERDEQIWQSKS